MASSKSRQRALARAKQERQIARRAASARRRRQWQAGIGGALVLAVLVVLTIWKTGGFDPAPIRAADCAWTPEAAGTQNVTDVGRPRTSGVLKNGVKTMTVATDQGTIITKLDPAKAPCTVESFTYLASKKFFDNSSCHRLTDAILQCGDPSGSGSGGPGYHFANEYVPAGQPLPSASPDASGSTPNVTVYPRGTVAMAHSSQPDSNGSQFFLVYKDVTLPADYTIFGTIVSGLDAIDKIAAGGNDGSTSATDGKPKIATKIQTLTVTDTAPPAPSTSAPAPSTSASSTS